jgi:prevent-host-death family protein
MKVVALEDANDSLSNYVRRSRRGALILTRRGRPVSALVPLRPGGDVERAVVAADPRFQAILARSRAEVREDKVLSQDDVRQAFGLKRTSG